MTNKSVRVSRQGILGALLRTYSADLKRFQRIADPLIVMGLFSLLVSGHDLQAAGARGKELEIIVVGLCSALILPFGKIYQSYRQGSLFTVLRRLTTSWLLVLATLLAMAFAAKTTAFYSRTGAVSWAFLTWLFLVALHVGGRKLVRFGHTRVDVKSRYVYWGPQEAAVDFHNRLKRCPYLSLQMMAWFSPQPVRADLTLPDDMPRFGGNLADLRRWLNTNDVDQIIFSYVERDDMSMQDLVRFFGDSCVPVVYAPTWVMPGMTFRVDNLCGQPCIDLWRPLDSAVDRQLKRLFDISVAGLALLILSPVFIAVALAIRLTSDGPVLFLQDRYGLDGRRFKIVKFRTMRVIEAGGQKGLRQATRNDPRITPVGAFLRRWSIDELPQLLNVVRGEMSLVGPRPHAVDHNEQYRRLIPGYMQRHLFQPGITGLAQVRGFRGETSTIESMAERIAADLEYQCEWSLPKDVKILVKTLLKIKSPNAY